MCSFLWKCHKNSLIETLQSLLESDTLLDCTIAAGGQYLKAHKVILAASSPYFKLLFSQEQEKNPIVVLKDVSFQELQCIIEYIYKGEVEVPPGQVKSFLRTADSLQIVGLLGSTQEKVDEGNSGCIAVTSNVSIAHKQSKHIYQETNLRENASTQAHFSATDESSEISPLNISSVHSKTSSVSPFHFKEKCVQDSSRIHNRNQNFDAPSSEILVENIVETNLVNDNHPVVPFVDKKLITDNHEDRGLSNYCDSSLTHDACDNTTVNDTRERQKESVVNSFSMQQEPFLIIKQDPDSVEISEEHYEDRMGYCGGDFLEGNSTVGPQGDVVNAPHTPVAVGCTASVLSSSSACALVCERQDLQRKNCPEHCGSNNLNIKKPRTSLIRRYPWRNKGFVYANNGHQLRLHARDDVLFQRPYLCHVCGRGFGSKQHLVDHYRIHTGEKPFQCLHCSKRFNKKSNLTVHMRIHTDEKPHECNECDRRFCTLANLNYHKRSHNKLK